MLIEQQDVSAFSSAKRRPIAQFPQSFLLASQGTGTWMEVHRGLRSTLDRIYLSIPSKSSGSIVALGADNSMMAIAELLATEADSVTVRAAVVPCYRLEIIVTRPDDILASNFKCTRIVDESGKQWPFGTTWLNHGGGTDSSGAKSVRGQAIAVLPVGIYSVTIECLSGQATTKQVQIDGLTGSQVEWFFLE